MTKTKEAEVPYPELNPYKKKKRARLKFLTYRITESDGSECIFETSQEGAKIAGENAKENNKNVQKST